MMDWGNAFIRSKNTDPSGVITSIEADLHLAGDFKKTSKKVTWLADPSISPLVPVTLIDYDYLITKKRLEEDDNLDDVVNPKTEYRVRALASKEVEHCKQWDIIQFERKGFYIYQGTKDAEGRMEFGFIPEYVSAFLFAIHSLTLRKVASSRPCRSRLRNRLLQFASRAQQRVAGASPVPRPRPPLLLLPPLLRVRRSTSPTSRTVSRFPCRRPCTLAVGSSKCLTIDCELADNVSGEEEIKPDTESVNMYQIAPVYDA